MAALWYVPPVPAPMSDRASELLGAPVVATAWLVPFGVRRIRFRDVIDQPSAVMAHGDVAEVRLGGNKLNTTQSLDLIGVDGSRLSYEAYLRGTLGAQVRAVLDALGAPDGAASPPVVDRRGVPPRDIAAIVAIAAIIVAVVVLVLTKMPG